MSGDCFLSPYVSLAVSTLVARTIHISVFDTSTLGVTNKASFDQFNPAPIYIRPIDRTSVAYSLSFHGYGCVLEQISQKKVETRPNCDRQSSGPIEMGRKEESCCWHASLS